MLNDSLYPSVSYDKHIYTYEQIFQGNEYALLLYSLVHSVVTYTSSYSPSSNIDTATKILYMMSYSLDSERLLTVKKMKAPVLQLVFHTVIHPPMIIPTRQNRTMKNENLPLPSKTKNLSNKP